MRLRIKDNLPFVRVEIGWCQSTLALENVLLDTGSASTVLSIDRLGEIGIKLEPTDPVHRIVGVGGSEFVFGKRLDWISLGECRRHDFEIEVGTLAYGFPLDGILGMDFMQQTGLIVNLQRLEVSCRNGN